MKLLSKIALVAAIAVPVLAACTKEGGKDSVAVTGVTLDKNSVELIVGQDGVATLTATVNPTDATNKNVSWSVADPNVAAITPNGASCAVAPGAVGTTTVTVKTEDGGKVATCNVTVKSASVEPTFVTVDPETATVDVAGQVQLTATVFPAEATDKSVTWSTADENIATVDPNGVVTGVANGTVVITATTVNGKTATCSVKVGGMAKLQLDEAWFSTNAALTYVTQDQGCIKYGWGGSPDWFNPIDQTMIDERTADFGLFSNMWDEDENTCYHTNLDWGQPYTSWGCREDIDFGQHNVTLTFPDNYTKVQIKLTANNNELKLGRVFGKDVEGTMQGGFVLYWSADGEEFVKFDNGDDVIDGKVDCPDWGSKADVTLEATEAVPSIAALRIESQKEDDWTHALTSFGIAELEVYAE